MIVQTQATQESNEIRPWPRMVDVLPMLSTIEKENLELSIKQYGIKQKIYARQNGEIIDGVHRKEIADKLGVECPSERLDLSEEDAFDLGLSLNIDRRQLSGEQLEEARKKLVSQSVKLVTESGLSQQKASEITGIPRQTISRNIPIARMGKGYNFGPNLKLKIPKAEKSRILMRLETGDKQAQIAADYGVSQKTISKIKTASERLEKKKETLSQVPFINDNSPTLLEGTFEEQTKTMADSSIDVIITDPLYGKQHLDQYEKLGEIANRLLKPNGSLLVMTGQSYLPDVLNLLQKNLTYNWMVAYLTPGGQSAQLWERKVNSFWKPIVWFVKDKYEGNWVGDVVKSAPNDNDKEFSKWQQSESGMTDLVERFTIKNDLILDPLMGTGTTGVAALRLGRRFIGIDSDPEMVKIAKQRMGVSN